MKKCILGLKAVCDDCGACEDDRCELDPNKLCDNCYKCLEITESYREIPIGRVLMDGSESGLPRKPWKTWSKNMPASLLL